MCWGFDCGDGWFDLIWNLSQAIENDAKQSGISSESGDWPEATQVKQKMGTLRFYLVNWTDTTSVLINESSRVSAKTCEVCGASGSTGRNLRSQVKTVCKEHAVDNPLILASSKQSSGNL